MNKVIALLAVNTVFAGIGAVTSIFLISKQNKMSKQLADFEAVLQSIDENTTAMGEDVARVGDEIQSLKDQISGLGLSAADEEGIFSKLDALSSKTKSVSESLKALGTKTEEGEVNTGDDQTGDDQTGVITE